MQETVQIFEVSPRDGLQNEPRQIDTTDKIHLIDLLGHCGFENIEATSFVSPKWVPQMADAAAVMAGIVPARPATYHALVPNLKGWNLPWMPGLMALACLPRRPKDLARRTSIVQSRKAWIAFGPFSPSQRVIGCRCEVVSAW